VVVPLVFLPLSGYLSYSSIQRPGKVITTKFLYEPGKTSRHNAMSPKRPAKIMRRSSGDGRRCCSSIHDRTRPGIPSLTYVQPQVSQYAVVPKDGRAHCTCRCNCRRRAPRAQATPGPGCPAGGAQRPLAVARSSASPHIYPGHIYKWLAVFVSSAAGLDPVVFRSFLLFSKVRLSIVPLGGKIPWT
jgi:hypothetical protein